MVPKLSFRNKSDLTYTVVTMPRHSTFIHKLCIMYVLCLIFQAFEAWQESQLLIDMCGFLKNVNPIFWNIWRSLGKMSFLMWLGSKLEISALLLFKVTYFKQKIKRLPLLYFSRIIDGCLCWLTSNILMPEHGKLVTLVSGMVIFFF